MRRTFITLAFACAVCGCIALAQNDQSLGDAARHAREQKQQKSAQGKEDTSKDAQGKNPSAKTPKVVTNDEIPEHSPTTAAVPAGSAVQYPVPSYSPPPSVGGWRMPPEQIKAMILAQKNIISSLQSEIDRTNDSIHYSSGACSSCAQWNERQREKQQAVERMRAQLEDQKKRLEDLQEAARRQGYGSSVYDP